MLTFRDEGNFIGQGDEDQGTDNEICTISSAGVDPGESTSASGSDKTEGLYNTVHCSSYTV